MDVNHVISVNSVNCVGSIQRGATYISDGTFKSLKTVEDDDLTSARPLVDSSMGRGSYYNFSPLVAQPDQSGASLAHALHQSQPRLASCAVGHN